VSLADYAREILASGFPGFRHLEGRALRAQLDGYVARIVDRDFEEQGHRVRRPQTLQRWLKAYAAATSTTATFEKIRDAATGGQDDKPTKVTSGAYREVLERLWIVEPVPAWLPTRNHISTLMHAPKHQLADPALAARLLGMDVDALMQGESGQHATFRDGSLLGKLFEALVTLSVRVYAQAAESTVKHLRTQGGRQEVDLIVVRGDQKVLAIEVKLSAVVNDDDVKHLLWLREKIGDDLLDAIVLTTGQQAYRRKDGIGVVPAALLGA
jgi:predicted AAA+ superfamily ATPase